MNLLDAGAVVLIVFAFILGLRSGLLPQLGGLIGAVLGGTFVVFLIPVARGYLDQLDPAPRALLVLGALVLAVALGEGLGAGAGQAASVRLGQGVLGSADRLAGAAMAVAQGILVLWLAGSLMATGPVPRLSAIAQTSSVMRTLSGYLPPLTEITADVGQILDVSGLPQVFVGLEPFPAPPVDVPADPQARAIAGPAEDSTARVSAVSCNALLTGTGFVVRSGYLVTNAHVVAGGSSVRVNIGGQTFDTTVVLFDSSLDVAVLWAPDVKGKSLRFAAQDPRTGSPAAALGHPNGGGLAVIPAAVAAEYAATGRDIYGHGRVTRNILELRAQVEPGDSGGPLILKDGTVGGVVFAEARSDQDVGYALSPISVATDVTPALGRTSAVSTGPCVR